MSTVNNPIVTLYLRE